MANQTARLKKSLTLNRDDYHWRLLCACANTVANYFHVDTSFGDDSSYDNQSLDPTEFATFVKMLFDAKAKEKEKKNGILTCGN